jgi:hypothetical protein
MLLLSALIPEKENETRQTSEKEDALINYSPPHPRYFKDSNFADSRNVRSFRSPMVLTDAKMHCAALLGIGEKENMRNLASQGLAE